MTIKVAINGYGRIGRNILRAHYEGGKKHDLQIVAINDLGRSADQRAPDEVRHRARHISRERWRSTATAMVVNGDRIKVLAIRNPAELPWGQLGVDVVLECTGLFTTKEKASAHLKGGAKKVIISAPGGKDVDATIVYGVNHGVLKAAHTVISNASLHDQLPGAAGQTAARQDRAGERPDDDRARVHQRSGADRRLSRGPAPRARRGAQHDSDQDRRGRGGRAWCCPS